MENIRNIKDILAVTTNNYVDDCVMGVDFNDWNILIGIQHGTYPDPMTWREDLTMEEYYEYKRCERNGDFLS